MESMDNKALEIVRNHIETEKHEYLRALSMVWSIASVHTEFSFETFIVWKCKALQNWKYLISTNLGDGLYYELTYNGDKREWYLDTYKHIQNECIAAD